MYCQNGSAVKKFFWKINFSDFLFWGFIKITQTELTCLTFCCIVNLSNCFQRMESDEDKVSRKRGEDVVTNGYESESKR